MDLTLPPPGRAMGLERSDRLRNVDVTLLAAFVLLAAAGLMMVYSATNQSLSAFGQNPGYYLKRQAVFLAAGMVALVVAAALDYRLVKIYAPFFYLFAVAALLLVQTPLGSAAQGAQRWFQIGAFQLSPSLFARLPLIGR